LHDGDCGGFSQRRFGGAAGQAAYFIDEGEDALDFHGFPLPSNEADRRVISFG
jgi:hypothetical protein